MNCSHRFPFTWQNKALRRRIHLWMFLFPSFLGIMVFMILPFGDVIRRSFLTVVTQKWVGLQNYRTLFQNQAFCLAVKNTLRFTGVCIPLLLLLGFWLAWLLCGMKGVRWIRSLYLFPLAMPTATTVLVWKMVFYPQGFLNKLLSQIGTVTGLWGSIFHDYLGSDLAFWVLVFSYIWKNSGYTMVLWMAGILAVPKEQTEAAWVDGAGSWQRFYYVVFPQLRGCLITILILSFLNSFKIYREAYLVAGSYPDESMYLLQHLFNNWYVNLEFDKMAAASVCIGAVLFVVIVWLQRLWRDQ